MIVKTITPLKCPQCGYYDYDSYSCDVCGYTNHDDQLETQIEREREKRDGRDGL